MNASSGSRHVERTYDHVRGCAGRERGEEKYFTDIRVYVVYARARALPSVRRVYCFIR
jgi:hypothetical protein